jgi:hypothetical protein
MLAAGMARTCVSLAGIGHHGTLPVPRADAGKRHCCHGQCHASMWAGRVFFCWLPGAAPSALAGGQRPRHAFCWPQWHLAMDPCTDQQLLLLPKLEWARDVEIKNKASQRLLPHTSAEASSRTVWDQDGTSTKAWSSALLGRRSPVKLVAQLVTVTSHCSVNLLVRLGHGRD